MHDTRVKVSFALRKIIRTIYICIMSRKYETLKYVREIVCGTTIARIFG